ncbi:class I adenylate-forming enzyme family protein [Blastochloris viridis]|uniref:Long-chain-fatty-acid--CoA ligase n=1 Tax=Blastochloris viridis TaxID=1079 RepID=A0A0H5BAD8_BLAVI|nr:class I adenylate-forming enzyme family protein [Blastochloris viridis]ALK08701.1 Long-chain-fatty-acid--CoA ligase [Blastochloris viridis]BAR98004.1 small Molecule Metabolism [Blastochloris viridis]CUU41364.1 Long-chain-fatty-acid--CoA ligase [Blastochloris viridis]
MRVEDFLIASAAAQPDKIALIAGERRLSYRDLDHASDRLAAALIRHGIQRGDRVVVFLDNCAEAVIAIFAALKAGAVFCPINPSTKAEKVAFLLNDCRASALITGGRLGAVAHKAIASSATVKVTVVANAMGDVPDRWLRLEDALAAACAPPPRPGIGLDLAMLIYTSGSTGLPKGVMMTHQAIVAAATAIASYLGNTADDIVLSVLPVSFNYGLYQVLVTVKTGATLVLEKSFAFPQAVLQKAAAEHVTGLPLVPTMVAVLLRIEDFGPGRLPHLRYLTTASAPLAPSQLTRLAERFPDAELFSMYGQTECTRGTYLPPHELKARPDSVGIAIPGTEATVVDDDGRPVAPGVVGELVIRGPHVMKGYWENPEATARSLRPGPFEWEKVLHTGDLFRTDAAGFLYFVSRKDDIIKTRGEKVSPKEVETVIHALPGVHEVVVVGIDDAVLGTAIKAIVVAEPGALTGQDVIRHCARHLEDFMVPKEVEFRDTLPKSDNGKIDRRAVTTPALEAAT